MLARTGDQRWAWAWRALADHLMLRYGERVAGFWTQRLYGSCGERIGPAHGMAGIVAHQGRHLARPRETFRSPCRRPSRRARRRHGRGRYSLWTGDLGTDVYLHQCIIGTSEMPTLDIL
jgi:hypothetical protein